MSMVLRSKPNIRYNQRKCLRNVGKHLPLFKWNMKGNKTAITGLRFCTFRVLGLSNQCREPNWKSGRACCTVLPTGQEVKCRTADSSLTWTHAASAVEASVAHRWLILQRRPTDILAPTDDGVLADHCSKFRARRKGKIHGSGQLFQRCAFLK